MIIEMLIRRVFRPILKLGTPTKCILVLITAVVPFVILTFGRGSGNTYLPGQVAAMPHLLNVESQNQMRVATQDDLMRERFAKRRLHLKKQCAINKAYHETHNSENAVKEHLTIDNKHHLVYCAIEKIGSTFWKRVFQILSGFQNVTDPFQIQGINAYQGYLTAKGMPFDKIHLILKSSRKFMFVREPFERLLSGYVDKLFAPNAAYWNFIGTFVVNNFRGNASELSQHCGHDVTFEEFARYFIHSHYTNEKRDAHFVPNFEHCRPCEIDYEYIGKQETFQEDTMFLLKELNLDEKVHFKNFQQESERDAIIDSVNYVISMKAAILRCMSLHEAFLRVYRKLQIRGILSREISFPFKEDASRDLTPQDYQKAFLKVHSLSGPPSSRKSNRREAFMEAYSTLSQGTRTKLQEILNIDADLFGYGIPEDVVEAKHEHETSFKYFHISKTNYKKNVKALVRAK